jgi:thiamine monophosphate synthase
MRRYCITDSLDVAARAAGDAVEMIQIRAKELSARDLMDLVRGAVAIPRARILVNTRADVALACGAGMESICRRVRSRPAPFGESRRRVF